jgi:hypothetical protein
MYSHACLCFLLSAAEYIILELKKKNYWNRGCGWCVYSAIEIRWWRSRRSEPLSSLESVHLWSLVAVLCRKRNKPLQPRDVEIHGPVVWKWLELLAADNLIWTPYQPPPLSPYRLSVLSSILPALWNTRTIRWWSSSCWCLISLWWSACADLIMHFSVWW